MKRRKLNPIVWILQKGLVAAGAFGLTLATFLVLPLLQVVASPPPKDLMVSSVDVAQLPPPPPPPPEEPAEEEPEKPEEPPQLEEQAQPLDLDQLELALNPGFGDGMFGDFSVKLVNQIAGSSDEQMEQVFSLADLDQRPRAIFQRAPAYPPDLLRRSRKGTVYVVFKVNKDGRVVEPRVEKATDPAFEDPALEAVKQWRFEPGTRNGEKVQFKMRVPITFNAS